MSAYEVERRQHSAAEDVRQVFTVVQTHKGTCHVIAGVLDPEVMVYSGQLAAGEALEICARLLLDLSVPRWLRKLEDAGRGRERYAEASELRSLMLSAQWARRMARKAIAEVGDRLSVIRSEARDVAQVCGEVGKWPNIEV